MQHLSRIYSNLFFILSLLLVPFFIKAQVTFQKVYPTAYDKTSREVLATPDGGYIIAGSTNNSNVIDCDIYVIKTNSSGDTLWTRTYGGPKPDYAYSMLETSDGNYFILGFSQSFGGGDYDTYLIKINSSGALLWQKIYGGSGNEHGREIIKTTDGNYVIVGSSNSFTASKDAFLMKIDLAGTVLWSKYYGGLMEEAGNSVKQCNDGGFILTGQTFNFGPDGDVYLVRTNSAGDTLWTKTFTDPLADEGISIVANNDGTYTFAVRDSTATTDVDIRIIKTTSTGNVIWNKRYAGTDKDTPKRIRPTNDGGYIIGAISRSFGWINPDMWLLKLNAAGDTTWSRHYGGSDHEHCHDIKQTADGGYIACGQSRSYGPGQKIIFLKLDASGQISVVPVEEFSLNNISNIYPNPTEGIIKVVFARVISLKINITNTFGQIVFTEKIETFKKDEAKVIDFTGNTPGIYFLTCQTRNNITTNKIILK